MLQLVFYRDNAFSLAEADAEKTGQSRYYLNRLLLLLILNHPDNDVQCIIQKMRINLGLKGVKFAFPFGLMLCHNIFHQGLDPLRHIAN